MPWLDRGSVFSVDGIGNNAEPCEIVEQHEHGRIVVRFLDGRRQSLQRTDNLITNAPAGSSPTIPWRLHR